MKRTYKGAGCYLSEQVCLPRRQGFKGMADFCYLSEQLGLL